MPRKPTVVIVVLALVGSLIVVGIVKSIGGSIALPRIGPDCTVRADGEVTLDATQMANAATISAVGLRRGMPDHAVTVALATALQESKLENLDSGDRDSIGLFQQRPSQGWGPADKLNDPRYAANKFYTALTRIKGWRTMPVTEAAQRVQRSAYPQAYEKWADEAAVLARALTGEATGAVACTVTGRPALRGAAASSALLHGLQLDWGENMARTATQTPQLTVDVNDSSAGWQYAHWLVAHAHDSGLERVRFAQLEWRAPTGQWQRVNDPADDRQVVAEVYS